jgi:hypothetical protein
MKTKTTAQTESFDAGEILASTIAALALFDVLLFIIWVLR